MTGMNRLNHRPTEPAAAGTVALAKAGVQATTFWIPAFAGMTGGRLPLSIAERWRGGRGVRRRRRQSGA